ncbi:MAG: SpoIID/LytB domain-containing protein [Cyanobacteriota bacterium]|nr:SpoIID/LytB domain-containing protein [Cyanobacteriota bacterium]
MIATPLALSAVGVGVASQSLLRPPGVSGHQDVLDALLAAPPPERGTAAPLPGVGPSRGGAAEAGALRARRIAPAARGGQGPGDGAGAGVNLEIRVALMKLSANPTLGAEGHWRVSTREGQPLREGSAGGLGSAADLLGDRSEVWVETDGGGLVADGRAYGGRFRLLRAAAGIQVVNHLPLESYISSVVGGEMPSHWSQEALRAQAVAARSYAMAHMARPASEHWHLGDTTRWQNYEGLRSVSEPTRQATGATAGVILSYQGGIVESLYAATQQIVDEAHGHLGASMSQTGAQELAQQGLRYPDILNHYYRGASLARLQLGAG